MTLSNLPEMGRWVRTWGLHQASRTWKSVWLALYLCCPPGKAFSGLGVKRSLFCRSWFSPVSPGTAFPYHSWSGAACPSPPTIALKNLEAVTPLLILISASFLRTLVVTWLLYKQYCFSHYVCVCVCVLYIPRRMQIAASATLQTIRTCRIREQAGNIT